MLILALDTSSATISVAVLNEENVLYYTQQTMERGHGEALIPLIDATLKRARAAISDITGIAVAVGPGSFTGVRVGLSTARGIGLALNIPVYGVTNFEAVAYGVLKPITVVLDTKRGDYFTQLFDANGHPSANPIIQSAEQLKHELPFTAIGDGALKLQAEIGCDVTEKISPTAVSVGKIALTRLAHPLPPEPIYLRDADVTL
ncbi:MAG: tRNA (adenosine(37)-N6)-threonylcarbamoyltransferase complex dimerization subunit type 1 TsaB [Alphaproteobacteria bacterium]